MERRSTSPKSPRAAVRRAVVPAAGRGVRMRQVANGGAKELLTVGGRSLVAHALADLAASGVTDALVVTSAAKPQLAARLGGSCAGVKLHYVEQDEPRGLADALSLAESFAAGEPFLVWLPDNLWRSSDDGRSSGRADSASAQLVAALRHAPDSHLVGLVELERDRLARHGAAGFVESTPLPATSDVVRVDRVLDKGTRPPPPAASAASHAATVLKGFPLDLYQPDVFDQIRAQRSPPVAGELDDTPLLQHFARAGRLHGVVLRGGTLFDCGIPEGLAAARARLGE